MAQETQIWMYAADTNHASVAAVLASRLNSIGAGPVNLVTSTGATPPHLDRDHAIHHADITSASAMVGRMKQADQYAVIWLGSPQFENLHSLRHHDDDLVILCNLTQNDIPKRRLKLFLTHVERILREADLYFTQDTDTAGRLAALGIEPKRICALGPLQKAGAAPSILGDADEFVALKGRSMWSAISVTHAEVMAVLMAHKAVLRESHRMLLLLSPADARDEPAFVDAIKELGLRFARRLDDEYPDNHTAVFLADGPDEFARWLSMAPLAFLGNSLRPEMKGIDPMSAAALGVAVLYGPYISTYLNDYSQLAKAGAARIVRDADSLATAVLQVSNPQLAAQMGYAGWDLSSAGAEATDAVVARVQNWIEEGQG